MAKILLKSALVLIISGLLHGCGSLFYWPETGLRMTPDQLGFEYKLVNLKTDKNLNLYGWWFPSRANKLTKPKGLIYFLHGNTENISVHFMSMSWIAHHGWEVFIIDYRGYGLSEGKPNIKGIHEDAYTGLKWAIARAKEQEVPLVVLGQSIGGATAITLVGRISEAEQLQISGLIVDSPLSSYRRIAREKMGMGYISWVLQYPMSWTIPDPYSPEKHLAKIRSMPFLIMHSCEDQIIYCTHSQRLYKQAKEPKTYWQTEKGKHIQMLNQYEWRNKLVEWLDENIEAKL